MECWHWWKQKKDWSERNGRQEFENGNMKTASKRIRPQDAARVRLFLQGEENIPIKERIYGEAGGKPGECADGYLRPSFIQPYCCKNVRIEGIRIEASPMWEIHPVLCENVSVCGVHIDTHLSNNDGIDPECCRDVLIENCIIDVGDDCIAIKSGRNEDARRIGAATENVVIQNNIFKDGHGGITIGSELTGGIRGIYVRDNVMESPNLWSALRFKTNDIRGGVVEQCYYKNNEIKQLESGRKPVLVETQYEIISETAVFAEHEVSYHKETPVIKDIYIEGMTKEDADIRGDNIMAEIHWYKE